MKFTTTIEQDEGKGHAGIPVPTEVVDSLGAGKRPAVIVSVGGHTYRSSIAPMGGRFLISLSSSNRTAADVVGGDVVEVEIELDTAPRMVDVPEDLALALKEDAEASAVFESISYSRKLRLALSVEGAKTEETRQRRVTKSIEDLKSGKA